MNFNDTLKYDLAVYSSIFPNRAAVLNHLFCTNGNGYDWSSDGTLAGDHGGLFNELVAIERYIGAGLHKQPLEDAESIPEEIIKNMRSFDIPADIEERCAQTEFTHWYPMSERYNSLEKLPDNIPADWLNAAWECANLVIATPIEDGLDREVRSKLYHFKGDIAKAKDSILWTRRNTQTIAMVALRRMKEQFPNHKFEQNPIPTFDAERPFEKTGITPWPVDESPVSFDLCIDPFEKALRFAYSMRRKNEDKDIPYSGLPVGKSTRVGSFGPEERFLAAQLKYDKEDQGRDAIEVILSCMAQICIEQGQRMAKKEIKKSLDDYFRRLEYEKRNQEWRAEQDALALTDSNVAAKLRVMDRMEANRKNNTMLPIADPNDPLEVEQAAVLIARQKEAYAEIMERCGMKLEEVGA